MADQHCPLSMLRPGEQGRLVSFEGRQKLRQRLADLGLTCGDCVRVISGECTGPMIIGVKQDARLALGRGMANKIIVQIESNEEKVV
ncbi:MAG: ferrous iron transport protein A [Anaerolineales bacterium]